MGQLQVPRGMAARCLRSAAASTPPPAGERPRQPVLLHAGFVTFDGKIAYDTALERRADRQEPRGQPLFHSLSLRYGAGRAGRAADDNCRRYDPPLSVIHFLFAIRSGLTRTPAAALNSTVPDRSGSNCSHSISSERVWPCVGTTTCGLFHRKRLSDLISTIYDCAIDPDRWPEAMSAICADLKCALSYISLLDLQRSGVRFLKTWNLKNETYVQDLVFITMQSPAMIQPFDEPMVASRHIELSPNFGDGRGQAAAA